MEYTKIIPKHRKKKKKPAQKTKCLILNKLRLISQVGAADGSKWHIKFAQGHKNLESINLEDISNDHTTTMRDIKYLLRAHKERADREWAKQKGPKDDDLDSEQFKKAAATRKQADKNANEESDEDHPRGSRRPTFDVLKKSANDRLCN